ncbi:glycosyltransferase family 2 protein [Roseovarius bejariae]|nr:glycosyltransferase [Roseovarius bejariae]
MIDNPLVSVIIPSYNHAQYIEYAIESVLAQTYPNIELIIVDDGSSDNSHEVIRKYEEHPQIRIILNKKNKGQSAVINQALAASSGKYIAILPSDDWFLPEKIALQVAKMEACDQEVGVVYAAGARYFEDTEETANVYLPVHTGWIARNLIEWGNFIYPVTPLYRRDVFDKVRPSEQFKAEGEAIHLRIAIHFRYEYVDAVVAIMRDHSYNIGKDATTLNEELAKHREWYFSLPELPDDIKALKKVSLLRLYRVKAMQLIIDRGEGKTGRINITKAFKLAPLDTLRRPKLVAAFMLSFLPRLWLISFKKIRRSELFSKAKF